MPFPLINMLQEHNTVLIHGTSLEATINLLTTGVFDHEIRNDKDYIYQNYLFFSPNGRYFQDNTLGVVPEECTWDKSITLATQYAKNMADVHFIQKIAHFRPKYVTEIIDGWNIEVEKLLLPEFKEHGFNRDFLRTLLKLTEKRHGVLLGLNEKIFEMNIEKGKDEPNREVCIYLPNGISIDYISAIQPIGYTELNILRSMR